MAEYEDAAWPEIEQWTGVADVLRVAIADGASESMLAGRWARLLARTACGYDPRALRHAVRRAARSWPVELAEYLADRPLAWWQAEKLARGRARHHRLQRAVTVGVGPSETPYTAADLMT